MFPQLGIVSILEEPVNGVTMYIVLLHKLESSGHVEVAVCSCCGDIIYREDEV